MDNTNEYRTIEDFENLSDLNKKLLEYNRILKEAIRNFLKHKRGGYYNQGFFRYEFILTREEIIELENLINNKED